MAVVKANAYGHGDVQVATTLQKLWVYDFTVSNIDEACALRKSGIQGQILILGYTPPNYADMLLKYDITQALVLEEYADALINTGLPIKCQYAIDTGMRV